MATIQGAAPSITNLYLVSSAEEYTFELSKWCKKFLVKARNKKEVRIAVNENETATRYITLPKGAVWWEDFVLGPIDLYFKADQDNVVIEIMQWYSRD